MKERFRWLAGAIAAHPDRTLNGRTRLQKEIKLLQRLGFPTDYSYTLHFYGPYSEGLFAEIGLLESIGLVTEEQNSRPDGQPSYSLHASEEAILPEVAARFGEAIAALHASDLLTLELAATYDMFRAGGSEHKEALERLRRKKPSKCRPETEAAALRLLGQLGLPTG